MSIQGTFPTNPNPSSSSSMSVPPYPVVYGKRGRIAPLASGILRELLERNGAATYSELIKATGSRGAVIRASAQRLNEILPRRARIVVYHGRGLSLVVDDCDQGKVRWPSSDLTPKEERLLAVLEANAGKAVPYSIFIVAMWPEAKVADYRLYLASVRAHLCSVRRKRPHLRIDTIRGKGLRLRHPGKGNGNG